MLPVWHFRWNIAGGLLPRSVKNYNELTHAYEHSPAQRFHHAALRRLEQEEMITEQSIVVDPDNVEEAVLRGL
jgi:hypothetical protein